MLAKTIIIIVMLVILASLASGLVFLVRDKGKTNRGVKSLTWRIGLSLCLFLAFKFHWIAPHELQQTIA